MAHAVHARACARACGALKEGGPLVLSRCATTPRIFFCPPQALVVDGLRRGLHECAKALSKAVKDGPQPPGGARLCLLAADCDEPAYVKLVKALCAERGVPLREVAEAKELGEMVGLHKTDKDGVSRKVVSTSVAVITDYGEASASLNILLADMKEAA